ncbi:hypothetical protein D0T49_05630 [Paludibacter sp. 221]|uniref:hypothetical protein n=1 Tax=Paludibacter sp. 221 TaxID=2302939 RepID=UPI0013D43B50|nr:hypothetical protein [Paludibacter sp. 221]NDV46522.1 hypothetical protein [Paludibacter sp. 221]
MNTKKYIIVLFILALSAISCHKKPEKVFEGELHQINTTEKKDTINGIEVYIDDIYTGYMSAYDSMLFFLSYKYPDYFIYAFDKNTGKKIGSFCKSGNGPDEFTSLFTFVEQYIRAGDEVKVWVYDAVKKIALLNITKSIKEKTSVFDDQLSFSWFENHIRPWSVLFMLNNGILIAKNQLENKYVNGANYFPITYSIYDISENEKIREIPIYNINNFVKNNKEESIPEMYFISQDRIKPDGKKIVSAMEMFSQINILDITTGKLTGYSRKNTPNINERVLVNKIYYIDLCVDDDYILALYSNVELDEFGTNYPFYTNEVHVYDWNGNFKQTIILDRKYNQIAIDLQTKLLYAKRNDEDTLFSYDISHIY